MCNQCCAATSCAVLGLINSLLIAAGGGLIAVGAWSLTHAQGALDNVLPHAAAASWLLIVAGILLLVAGAIGLSGTCNASRGGGRCALTVYVILLLVGLLTTVATFIMLLILDGQIKDERESAALRSELKDNIYPHCCANGEPDYAHCDFPQKAHIFSPESCSSADAFADSVTSWVKDHIKPMAIVDGLVAALLLVAAVFACVRCRVGSSQEMAERVRDEQSRMGLLRYGA